MNWRFGLIALAIFMSSWAQARSVMTDGREHFRHPGMRRFGLEVEYTGIPLQSAGAIAQRTLGGQLIYDKINGLDRMTLKNSVLGQDLIVKVETNMIRDGNVPPPEEWVCEIVAPPLFYQQLSRLQKFISALKEAGAKGTSNTLAVSTQVNLEILRPEIELPAVLKLLRAYLDPKNHAEVQADFAIPEIRKKFLGPYSPGMMKKLLDPGYFKTSTRTVYDDFFYRQTLELEGDKHAWTRNIAAVKQLIHNLGYPRNPQVVKLNSLRISSLLMKIFKDDPFTKAIEDDEWAFARPLIEFREENNNWDVIGPVERAYGTYLMVQGGQIQSSLSECELALKTAVGQ